MERKKSFRQRLSATKWRPTAADIRNKSMCQCRAARKKARKAERKKEGKKERQRESGEVEVEVVTYFAALAGEGAEVKPGRRFAAHFTLLIHLRQSKKKRKRKK